MYIDLGYRSDEEFCEIKNDSEVDNLVRLNTNFVVLQRTCNRSTTIFLNTLLRKGMPFLLSRCSAALSRCAHAWRDILFHLQSTCIVAPIMPSFRHASPHYIPLPLQLSSSTFVLLKFSSGCLEERPHRRMDCPMMYGFSDHYIVMHGTLEHRWFMSNQ